MTRHRLASLVTLFLLFLGCFIGGAAAQSGKVDIYFSPGSSNGRAELPPLQSAAAIDDVFDTAQRSFGVRRILWRGLQEEDYVRNQIFRPENLVLFDYWKMSQYLSLNQKLNRHAVQAAHRRKMAIWGLTLLFEFGAQPKEAVYGAGELGPASSEAHIRVRHPEWIPIDRHGIRRQTGPVEFAYPAARRALREELVKETLRYDYDGLMLMTYVEATDLWFEDEFGFNEPVVKEFKRRYGVDIRTQPFDVQAWRNLRGEYVTRFLRELKNDLQAHGKKLGMAIDPRRPQFAQSWLGSPTPIANAGSFTMDWETWIRQGIIDELMVGSLEQNDEFTQRLQSVSAAQAALNPKNPVAISVLSHPNTPTKTLASTLPNGWVPVLSASIPGFETESAITANLTVNGVLAKRQYLRELITRGSTAVPELEAALNDPENGVRGAAVMALGKVYGKETPTRIYQAVANRSNFQFDSAATQALVQMDDAQTPAIVAGLTHQVPAVRRVAAQALRQGQLRVATQQPQLQALSDSDPAVRSAIILGLPRFGDKKRVATALLERLNDKHPTVRTAAAAALGSLFSQNWPGKEEMEPAVRSTLARRFAEFNKNYKGSDAEWGFRMVGRALLQMGPQGRQVLTDLLTNSKDSRITDYAWRSLYLPPAPGAGEIKSLEQAEALYKKHPLLEVMQK